MSASFAALVSCPVHWAFRTHALLLLTVAFLQLCKQLKLVLAPTLSGKHCVLSYSTGTVQGADHARTLTFAFARAVLYKP